MHYRAAESMRTILEANSEPNAHFNILSNRRLTSNCDDSNSNYGTESYAPSRNIYVRLHTFVPVFFSRWYVCFYSLSFVLIYTQNQ